MRQDLPQGAQPRQGDRAYQDHDVGAAHLIAAKSPARFILAFAGLCALEKLVAIFVTGFNDDEAYTLVISRTLALSYFDHPPLHQWILHGFVALFGEGKATRLPFWAMIVATNWPLLAIARRLFGEDAGWWTVFAFNATAYFLVMPDGYIMPDTPMLLGLACAGSALAEILFAPDGDSRGLGSWLLAGFAFGLAGLAKYAAIFAPIGLFGFLLLSPRHRHWLSDYRPYLGAALALLIFSPALIWNAEHHWVSFAFQSGRAAASLSLDAKVWTAIAEGLGAQIALLSPWIAVPVALGLARAARLKAESGERFLLWLVAPPLLLFAFMPILGQRAIPHWFNSAWLFAFPLAGAWLAERGEAVLRLWARASVVLSAATAAIYVAAVDLGPQSVFGFPAVGGRDPTRYAYDWPDIRASAAWRGFNGRPPDFVVVDNWRTGGRVGVALGPGTPVCAFANDPRGFAFACDPHAQIGKDALIVAPSEYGEIALRELGGYFQSVEPGESLAVGRGGRVERQFTLARAHVLAKAFPLPYGPD